VGEVFSLFHNGKPVIFLTPNDLSRSCFLTPACY